MLTRFGLGTAQFGKSYGRFNTSGVPSTTEVGAILRKARDLGLSVVDTACQYGESEKVLGRWHAELHALDVITKTPTFQSGRIEKKDAEHLRVSFENSLRLLQLPCVGGLLVHDDSNLLSPGGELLYEQLLRLKQAGLVRRIGISGYTGETIERVVDKYPVDLVQLPVNLLDRRLVDSGTLNRLAERGIEIHARSAFLQGLLLVPPEGLPASFRSVKIAVAAFQAAAHRAGIKSPQAALHYLLQVPQLTRILIGVESITQLCDIFDDFPTASQMDYAEFRTDDIRVLDPSRWEN